MTGETPAIYQHCWDTNDAGGQERDAAVILQNQEIGAYGRTAKLPCLDHLIARIE